ncbi:MAG: ornithine aminomutase subunit alpha [Clostridium sp.]|uniref:ornithine aminomutase subunit alpha n=1 Tax=Clostridium culturomicium TaxID=1499683 RepID=UPI00058CDFE9|nr:ornithine aminomutase subunit alpha [Clostridium culturomicium]MDU4890719.1 ornithine aminomutase subunit alpha [Clostridium sp.]MDU7082319.1 ornithine aminomutase subunit alpha [Clostridium sp.]
MKREDDFEIRRKHLADLSDEELYERFWKLTEQIVDPLIDLAYNHTSSSIERSVLLRMGFSSIESDAIVAEGLKAGLLGKGMGNVVLKYGDLKGMSYLEAGRQLAQGKGWNEAAALFKGGVVNC